VISKIIDATPAQARALLTATAVRTTAQRVLALAREERLAEWRLDMTRLPATADFVTAVIRERYPQLDPPFHARWRHFVFQGRDLWREIADAAVWESPAARARAEFDLVITSVLLDAGAGAQWSYRDTSSGVMAARSEGLALASLRWFAAGAFSSTQGQPLRADATGLQRIDTAALTQAFQASRSNVLAGAEGRAALLNRLGATVHARPDLFALADEPRPGGLLDAIAQRATAGTLPAATVLELLLEAFGPIWQGRPSLQGVPLGDCWPYPPLAGAKDKSHFVPLHKLSQWLAYSLIEPLAAAGITVSNVDGLTGLAEYRNGGLFVDMEVLVPREADLRTTSHAVMDPFVVGWRALTVALLDELAPQVRARLGLEAAQFPLAKLLEGGTWAAGRQLARERRATGGPPFHIISDGTVF
jgi:preprotein translocase subunit SecG